MEIYLRKEKITYENIRRYIQRTTTKIPRNR